MKTDEKIKLVNAKRELYYLLLSTHVKELSKVEIKLGHCLAKDKDMQAVFEKAREKEGVK